MNQSFPVQRRHISTLKRSHSNGLLGINSLYPKKILTKIRKKCFSFLWTSRKQAKGIPLVKWSVIYLPKESGGWGIKNLTLLCKSLASKAL